MAASEAAGGFCKEQDGSDPPNFRSLDLGRKGRAQSVPAEALLNQLTGLQNSSFAL